MKTPKSYRYYKLSDLAEICQVTHKIKNELLGSFPFVQPSELLALSLAQNQQAPTKTEKAKSELLVMPILVDMWQKNLDFRPFSGYTFNVDALKGLNGRCDFLIGKKPDIMEIEAPIVSIFEAKNDNIEDWYGQCGAEMFAARLFNERKNNHITVIHGAVTNGFNWQFLRLEGQILYIDSQRYGTANLPQLLGAIQKIYDFYKT